MKLSANAKYILFFGLFLSLHYIEGLPPIGGLSIAQLWKIPILIYLLIYNVLCIRKRYLFEKSCYLLSIETLFNLDILIQPIKTIVATTKLLPLALFFGYWVHRYRDRDKDGFDLLEKCLYGIAQFICITSLLTLLGFITPIRDYSNAESFGIKGLVYYSSLFGAPHAAASYFVISTLILINGFLKKRFVTKSSKIFNALLIAIALASVFRAYVRTGWLMLIVGLLSMIDYSRLTFKRMLISFTSVFIIVAGILVLYNTNEAFYARITGKNIYSDSSTTGINLTGSGRNSFWKNSIDLWSQSETYELFFGNGFLKVTENNLNHSGLKVISHNQFLDALSQNGIIGLLLLASFYLFIYRFIQIRKNSSYYSLNKAIFYGALIFSFFQNGIYFNYALLFSISLALLYLDANETGNDNRTVNTE